MMSDETMFECDVCSGPYRHGPHRYEGHKLYLYGGIFACDACWKGNYDGWAPHYEDILLNHLERLGLPVPERNTKDLLPRG